MEDGVCLYNITIEINLRFCYVGLSLSVYTDFFYRFYAKLLYNVPSHDQSFFSPLLMCTVQETKCIPPPAKVSSGVFSNAL